MCVQSHISILCSGGRCYIFFFRPSLLFVLVTLLSTIICAFFVSYFKERCSFAIIVRKKKIKREHVHAVYYIHYVHIYMLCIIIS